MTQPTHDDARHPIEPTRTKRRYTLAEDRVVERWYETRHVPSMLKHPGWYWRTAVKAGRAAHAVPTHWIFLDLHDFNDLVEASCADLMPKRASKTRDQRTGSAESGVAAPAAGFMAQAPGSDRHVRLPEVKRRTGMSRTTIYDRIKAGRFPRTVEMDGNIAAWRESELDEWLANPN